MIKGKTENNHEIQENNNISDEDNEHKITNKIWGISNMSKKELVSLLNK